MREYIRQLEEIIESEPACPTPTIESTLDDISTLMSPKESLTSEGFYYDVLSPLDIDMVVDALEQKGYNVNDATLHRRFPQIYIGL